MLNFIMTLFLIGSAQTHAKQLNTSLYEADSNSEKDKGDSFSAKVKVVREDNEGVEVFFVGEKQKGAYLLPRSSEHYATMLKDLENSKKPQGLPVSVTVDGEKRIKKVEKGSAAGKGFQVPTDPNQKWDFGNVPD